jgi:hypothetical protein
MEEGGKQNEPAFVSRYHLRREGAHGIGGAVVVDTQQRQAIESPSA